MKTTYFIIILMCCILYSVSQVCPPVPLGCLCFPKKSKRGVKISCRDLKKVSFTTLPSNLSIELSNFNVIEFDTVFDFLCSEEHKLKFFRIRYEDLEGNAIEVVDNTTFPNPNQIKKLVLKNNRISSLQKNTFEGFTTLRRLDMSGNHLNIISSNTFKGINTSSLVSLNLSRNRILSLSRNAFQDLRIDILDLSNQLNHLGEEAELIAYNDFLTRSDVKHVNLDGNRFLCDCNINWLSTWLGENKTLSKESNCYFPKSLRHQPIVQVLSKGKCHKNKHFSLPYFKLSPSTQQATIAGDSTHFTCQATWLPKAYFKWHVGGSMVNPYDPHTRMVVKEFTNLTLAVHTSVLELNNLTTKDNGVVTCELRVLDSGNTSVSTHLYVAGNETTPCTPNTTRSRQMGVILWPTTHQGSVVRVACPYGGIALRKCSLEGRWNEAAIEQCYFADHVTKNLQQLNQLMESTSRLKEVIAVGNQLSEFFQESYKIIRSKYDMYFIHQMVYKVLKTFRHLDGNKYKQFFWQIMNTLVEKSGHGENAYTENVYGETNAQRYQHLLEEYVHQESQKEPLLFSVDSYSAMAVLSYKQPAQTIIYCYIFPNNKHHKTSIQCTDESNPTLEKRSELSTEYFIQSKSSISQVTLLASTKHTFFPITADKRIKSSVLGIQIQNASLSTNPAPMKITFRTKKKQLKPTLLMWNNGEWEKSKLCGQLDSPEENVSRFRCYFTEFNSIKYIAISMEEASKVVSKTHYMASVVYIGAALSAFLLALTLFFYIVYREFMNLRSDTACMMNLCLSLVIANLVFACGMHRTEAKLLCKGVSVTLHYFMLCALLWLGCGGVVLIKMLNKKRRKLFSKTDSILKYYLLAWGFPMVICSITIAYDQEEYASREFCWLKQSTSIGAFIVPAGIFLLIDLVVFCYLHSLINRVLPEHHEQDDECNTRLCKLNKPPTIFELNFPKRHDLIAFLQCSLCTLLLFPLLFTFLAMMFVYRNSQTSRYLYHFFSYAAGVANLAMGAEILYYFCLKRVAVREKLRGLMCMKTEKVVENVELEPIAEEDTTMQGDPPLINEPPHISARADTTANEELPAVVQSVFTDHVDSEASFNRTQDEKAISGSIRQHERTAEVSDTGHTSIGECSLASSKKSRPKNPDIPDNLKNFVPENWRPVRRRTKKGASFYPYLNTDVSAKNASVAYAPTAMNHGASFYKQKNLCRSATNKSDGQYCPPQTAFPYTSGEDSNDRNLRAPNISVPVFLNGQYYVAHDNIRGYTSTESNRNTQSHNPQNTPPLNTQNPQNNFIPHNNIHVENNELEEEEEEEPIIKAPPLYIPIPHLTKKQFEWRAETKC